MKIVMLVGKNKCDTVVDTSEYDCIFEDVSCVLASPPATWADYPTKTEDDLDGILSMEIGELNVSKDKVVLKDQYEDYCHIAAAAVYAMKAIKDMTEQQS